MIPGNSGESVAVKHAGVVMPESNGNAVPVSAGNAVLDSSRSSAPDSVSRRPVAAAGENLPAGLPADWHYDRDLACPQCQYNLRMLRTPRCPECGLAFRWQALLHVGCPRCAAPLGYTDEAECPRCRLALDWAALLGAIDPARLRQYEYTRRPVRAALATWLAALRPKRFWAGIRMESPPSERRLRRLRRAALIVCVLGLVAGISTMLARIFLSRGLPSALIWTVARWLPAVGLVLVPPLVTSILLPAFTPTLARFRVRREQLLRCLAYAAAAQFWCGIVIAMAAILSVTYSAWWPKPAPAWPGGRIFRGADAYVDIEVLLAQVLGGNGLRVANGDHGHFWLNVAVGALLVALALLWWWRFVWVALRHYLRLDRPNAVALFVSTQIIALLATAFTFLLSPAFQYFLWLPERLFSRR